MDSPSALRVGIVGCGYQGGIFARTIATVTSLHAGALGEIVAITRGIGIGPMSSGWEHQ
jgi:hypothetical protein